jgi:hypothetical protein
VFGIGVDGGHTRIKRAGGRGGHWWPHRPLTHAQLGWVDDTHGSLVEGATRCRVALVVVLLHSKTQAGKHLGT